MTITVTVARKGHFYHHSLTRDGRTVMANGRIDASRAQEIVESNPAGAADAPVTFDPQPASWVWVYEEDLS